MKLLLSLTILSLVVVGCVPEIERENLAVCLYEYELTSENNTQKRLEKLEKLEVTYEFLSATTTLDFEGNSFSWYDKVEKECLVVPNIRNWHLFVPDKPESTEDYLYKWETVW